MTTEDLLLTMVLGITVVALVLSLWLTLSIYKHGDDDPKK